MLAMFKLVYAVWMIVCTCSYTIFIVVAVVDDGVIPVDMLRSSSPSSSSSYQSSAHSPSPMDSGLFESSTERKVGNKREKTPHLPTFKGHWRSFIDGLQRVLLFAKDSSIINRITSNEKFSQDIVQVSLTLKSVGLSLVDNTKKQEVAYIGIMQ